MGKVHWIVYIILGGAVLLASYNIDSQKFKLFIWIGYLFLIVGIAKLGIWFVTRRKESPAEKKEIKRELQPRNVMSCPRCKSVLYGYMNFCSRCGVRLRQRLL